MRTFKQYTIKQEIISRLAAFMQSELTELRAIIYEANSTIMAACLCMNTIELLGGISNGTLGNKGGVYDRFEGGMKLINEINVYNRVSTVDLYIIRNGLVHTLNPANPKFTRIEVINDLKWSEDEKRPPPIIKGNKIFRESFMVEDDIMCINVNVLHKNIVDAWKRLLNNLKHDDILLETLSVRLLKLPETRGIKRAIDLT